MLLMAQLLQHPSYGHALPLRLLKLLTLDQQHVKVLQALLLNTQSQPKEHATKSAIHSGRELPPRLKRKRKRNLQAQSPSHLVLLLSLLWLHPSSETAEHR